jgi:hypothetical protein
MSIYKAIADVRPATGKLAASLKETLCEIWKVFQSGATGFSAKQPFSECVESLYAVAGENYRLLRQLRQRNRLCLRCRRGYCGDSFSCGECKYVLGIEDGTSVIEGISSLSGLPERMTLMTISLSPGVGIGVSIISTASIGLCTITCLGMVTNSKFQRIQTLTPWIFGRCEVLLLYISPYFSFADVGFPIGNVA